MVLGCGTVSLGVASSLSSSSTTSAIVPEGVPPERESQPEIELESEPEPEPELDALGAQQELAPDQQRLDFLEPAPGPQRESQPTMSFRTKSGATVCSVLDFLVEANLSRYADLLIAQGGLQLNEIKAVTEDQLLGLGVTKQFHRLRFLREARQMVPIVA